MKFLSHFKNVCFIFFTCLLLTACEPEVGSERWCAKMEATPKGDWSANMATDYAKHCIFKIEDKNE